MPQQLQGSVRVPILHDVSEEIRLDELRRMLGAQPRRRETSFKDSAPEYARFERPLIVEPAGETPKNSMEVFTAFCYVSLALGALQPGGRAE